MRLRSIATVAAFALALGTTIGTAHAEDYPTKYIRIVTPYGPGGTADIMARRVGKILADAWGQSVVVENKPGASGMIGTEAVAKAAPDGYTLLAAYVTEIAVAPSFFSKIQYQPLRDLAPVALTALTPMILVMTPSIPAKSLQEFVSLAKAKPNGYAFASAGYGSPAHLAGELLLLRTGIQLTHVPYKGGGQALMDTISGQTAFFFSSMPSAMPHITSGRLRGIAVSTSQRSAAAPDVPTVAEVGGFDFDVGAWNGLFAPAGTPSEIISKLNAAVTHGLMKPEIRKQLLSEGAEVTDWSADRFREFVKGEIMKFDKLIKDAHVKTE